MTSAPTELDALLITADRLRAEIEAGRDVVLLEVRRESDGTDARHLPGAHVVVLTRDLVAPPAAGTGNLPLPSEEQLQERLRRWGIHADSLVVAYSSEHPALAARAWWTLTWAGVPDVRVLDGGAAPWVAAGGELVDEPAADAKGTFAVRVGALPTLDAEEAAALARSGVLLDARAVEGYTGESGGGHIPGAVSLPGSALVDSEGRLKSADELRRVFDSVGATGAQAVGAYCGGGTTATLAVLALASLGVAVPLYPGSFSAYSSDPARPIATGSAPG